MCEDGPTFTGYEKGVGTGQSGDVYLGGGVVQHVQVQKQRH